MPARSRNPSLLDAAAPVYTALAALVGVAAVVRGDMVVVRTLAGLLLVTLVLGWGRSAARTIVRARAAGRERSVGAGIRHALATLDDRYRVTRTHHEGVERQDHVVVGPNGVFVIVAASGDGRTRASRRLLFPDSRARWRDLIDDCHIEALRAGERLRRGLGRPVAVHPVLCVGSGLVTVGREVRGVRVVRLSDLVRVLRAVPAASPLDTRAIGAAVAALTTTAEVIPLRPRTAAAPAEPVARDTALHHHPTRV